MMKHHIDDIFPYATLVALDVSKSLLEENASKFQCQLHTFSRSDVFLLTTLIRNAGEHKLQLIDLLATVLLTFRTFPKAKMSLNVRHDFMKDPEKKWHGLEAEVKSLNDGYLKISSACQLFLLQAGFNIQPQEDGQFFSAAEILVLGHQTFDPSSDRSKRLKGA